MEKFLVKDSTDDKLEEPLRQKVKFLFTEYLTKLNFKRGQILLSRASEKSASDD